MHELLEKYLKAKMELGRSNLSTDQRKQAHAEYERARETFFTNKEQVDLIFLDKKVFNQLGEADREKITSLVQLQVKDAEIARLKEEIARLSSLLAARNVSAVALASSMQRGGLILQNEAAEGILGQPGAEHLARLPDIQSNSPK